MASGAGLDANGHHKPASVSCLTEQGTRVYIPPQLAARMAANGGVYNPYRQASQPQPSQQPQQFGQTIPAVSQPLAVASSDSAASSNQVQAAYGSMRYTDHPF